MIVTWLSAMLRQGEFTGRIAVPVKWSDDDPYAVVMSFGTDEDGPKDWHMSRDMLADAVSPWQPVGAWMDVMVQRSEDGDHVIVTLFPLDPEQATELHFPVEPVEMFLRRTFDAVPLGSERIDWDRELEMLLS